MEALFIAGLAYAGIQLNKSNHQEIKQCDKKQKYSNLYDNKVYNSNNIVEINTNKIKKKIKRKKRKKMEKRLSEINKDFKNKSNDIDYNDQFKVLQFNSSGPASSNDLINDDSFSNFNNNNMTYNIIDKEHFQHNNMNHSTSARDFPVNSRGNVISEKLNIFTGNGEYKPKKEVGPIFEPMKDLTYINGAPVNTDFLQTRYLTTYKKNFENKPFETNVKIIPGFNGKNQEGLYNNTRFLPKNTDELRNTNNPKESYKGFKLETVKKGELRGIKPNLETRKPMTYKMNDQDNVYPTLAHNRAQTIRDNFNPTYTNRTTSIYHSGPAKDRVDNILSDNERPKIRLSNKTSKSTDSISRNVTGNVKTILQNKKSLNIPNTRRQATSDKTKVGIVGNSDKSYAINRKDIPLKTLKQSMIHNKNILGVSNPQQNKSYVFDKNRVLPNTIKQTTINNNRTGIVTHNVNKRKVYNEDKPKNTIKQTTVNNVIHGNVTNTIKKSTAFDPDDKPNVTNKQTLIDNNRLGGANNNDKMYIRTKDDIAKTTIKQTTLTSRLGGADGYEKPYTRDNDDIAKTTIKQTTLSSRLGGADGYEKPYTRDNDDIAKTTIKQTTLSSRLGGADGYEKPYTRDNDDIAKTTVKQTTLSSRLGGADGYEKPYTRDNYDIAKTTIKQTTLASRIGGADGNEGTYIKDYNDKARTTIKQTTHASRIGMADGNEGTYMRDKNDLAKTTIKQTTHASRIGIADGNEGTYMRDNNDLARTTIKQTTHASRIGIADGNDGTYVRDNNDIAKTTVKQTTLSSRVGMADGNDGTYVRDLNDSAKTTVRQTTLSSRIGAADGQEATYARDDNDTAKTTVRQTTLSSRSGTLGPSVDKNTGYITNKMEAPNTQRQTLHQSRTGQAFNNKDKGYMTNKMVAPTTTKQTTLLQNYTGGMKHEQTKQKTFDDVLNMETNKEREKISQGRYPTQRKHDLGPDPNGVNVELKEYINQKRENIPSLSLNNNTNNNMSSLYSRNKEALNEYTSGRLDPNMLNALKDNPYVNNLLFNNN
jgi:hypothetical protein